MVQRTQMVMLFLLLLSTCYGQQIYYSSTTGVLTDLNSWGTTFNGGGDHPVDFTQDNCIYVIASNRGGSNNSLTSNWTVSGSGSRIIDSSRTYSIIIPDAFVLSGTVELAAGVTLNIKNATPPTMGTLDNSSTVAYASTTSSQTIAAGTYGNLKISPSTNYGATFNGDIIANSLQLYSPVDYSGHSLSIKSGGTITIYRATASLPSEPIWLGTANLSYNQSDGNYQTGNEFPTSTSVLSNLSITLGTKSVTLNKNCVINGILTITSGTLILNNDCTINGSLTLNGGVFNLKGKNVTINGNITGSGGTTITGSSATNLTISGGSGTLKFTTGAGALNNLIINNPSSTITLGTSSSLTIYGTLSLTSGILALNGNTLTVGGNIYTTSGTISGTTISSIIVNGGSGGVLAFTSGYQLLKSFTLNSAGSKISLGSNLTINSGIIITNGIFDLQDNLLTLAGTSSAINESSGNVITSSTGGGYITLTRTLNAPTSYNCQLGVTITSTANLGATTIKRYHIAQSGNGNNGIKRYYDITPLTNNGLNATVVFKYDASELNGITESNLILFKSTDNGLSWSQIPGTLDLISKTITVTGVNDFSKWTFGDSDFPLPVKLSSFASEVLAEKNVRLKWVTESEVNNSGFDIERSTDNTGKVWTKVGKVKGSGTKITPTNYSYDDNKLNAGKYKYRIKQIDFNGVNNYFYLENEVEIIAPKKPYLSQNYPNPFNPITKIDYQIHKDGIVKLVIYDVIGREIVKLVNEMKIAGYYTALFNSVNLSSGIYFYKLEMDGFKDIKRMLLIK